MIKLVTAFVSGILLSIPPGPATTALLMRARESRKKAFISVCQILLADLIIFSFVIALSQTLTPLLQQPLFRIGAGLFLIYFSLRFLFTKAKAVTPRTSSAFRLTLLNPAAWLGTVAVIGLSMQSSQVDFEFLLAFELGVLVWYVLLIEFIRKLSDNAHQNLLRLVIGCIGLLGVALLVQTWLKLSETL